MALAKASLPKVNRCNQRTRLRPRDMAGAAASNVAFQYTGKAIPVSGSVQASGTTYTILGNNGGARARAQEYLSYGLISVKT